MVVEHMLQVAADPDMREKVSRFWSDPERGDRYDAKFAELLSTLPEEAVPGFAEACGRYIRAWGSGGGSYRVEQCVYDAATTDYPRVLAVNIYRDLQAIDVDKTVAYCLIESIFEDAMEQAEGLSS